MEKLHFSYKNIFNAMHVIYKNEGILTFYSGLCCSLIVIIGIKQKGVVIYHGTGFFLYTELKRIYIVKNRLIINRWYIDFMIGGTSGLIG